MKAFMAEHYVLAVKLRRDKVDSFDKYPFSLAVVRQLDTLELHPALGPARVPGRGARACRRQLAAHHHYAVARRFLNDPYGQLQRILAPDHDDPRNGELF